MDIGLKGKVILLSASSKGIGYGIAEEVAKEGALLSIASRNEEDLKKAAEQLSRYTDVTYFVMDASKLSDIQDWVKHSISKYKTADGLLINAGGPKPGFFEDLTEEDWLSGYNLTLMSSVRMIREVLPYMKKQGKGSILTITSTSIKEPIDVLLLSNVFRSGVSSLVKSLSLTLGKYNIRVNNIAPGRIYTERVKSLDIINATNKGISVDEQRRIEESQIPLLRYGSINEIGKVGAFLLSDASSYVTGATIYVDGGKIRSL
ncbi:MAG: SDR family oxidoreductase [Calditerrivibrio sp.]|nr:SDR family oxidoreductase [Calditerrivibrio sp.]MCA1932690.1 SDR family oxidoreductase [Calditerrivibrio sp.]MCA1980761.1 SDR family oxidoreductase [Calditerrivibrio sp.]